MKSVLIFTPIKHLKKKLTRLLERRYKVYDGFDLFDFDIATSFSKKDHLRYLRQTISDKKIDLLIWVPAACRKVNFQYRDMLDFYFKNKDIFCITFNIKSFLSIEGDKANFYKNELYEDDIFLKNSCNNVLDIELLLVSNISALSNEIILSPETAASQSDKVSVSLIDDISGYIFDEGSTPGVSSQEYVLAQFNQVIKSAKNTLFSRKKVNYIETRNDRIETFVRQNACCLKPVYQLAAEDFWRGNQVSSIRCAMGAKLARLLDPMSIVDLDIIVPVPETGRYYAQGLARELGKPCVNAIVRKEGMGRGLQIENPSERNIFIRKKLSVIKELVVNKNIGIVDEAVFTGATLRIVVDQLKEAGAKKIHLLLPTPYNVRPCDFNVLPQRNILLDYVRPEDLKDYFDVNELTFSNVKDLNNSLGKKICFYCFDNRQ